MALPTKHLRPTDEKLGVAKRRHFQLGQMRISGHRAVILPVPTHQSQAIAKLLHFLQMKCFPATCSEATVLTLGGFFFPPSSLLPKEVKGCAHTIISQTLTCNNSGQVGHTGQTRKGQRATKHPHVLWQTGCPSETDRQAADMLRGSLQSKLSRSARQRGTHTKVCQRKIIFLSFMAHKFLFTCEEVVRGCSFLTNTATPEARCFYFSLPLSISTVKSGSPLSELSLLSN